MALSETLRGNLLSAGVTRENADALDGFIKKGLYHQLVEMAVPMFPTLPPALKNAFFVEAFVPLASKLNPLRYLELLGAVVLSGGAIEDPLAFLEKHAPNGVLEAPGQKKEEKSDNNRRIFGQLKHSDQAAKADVIDARALFLALKAEVALNSGKIEEAKDIVDTLEQEVIKGRPAVSVPPVVLSWYYKARVLLYHATGDSAKYYESGVNYLLYTPYENIQFDKTELAVNLGISALITPEEYHFGELLELSVFVKPSVKPWIYDLCYAFQEGKFELYDKALIDHKDKIAATPALASQSALLNEKFKGSVLLEYAFSQKARKRLDLGTLAEKTRVADVETLLINAMAAGLVRGSIDQVANIFCCTWVKPRVLDSARLQLLQERVSTWVERQNSVLRKMEELTPELLVS